MVNRENLIYETGNSEYDFQNFDRIGSFIANNSTDKFS